MYINITGPALLCQSLESAPPLVQSLDGVLLLVEQSSDVNQFSHVLRLDLLRAHWTPAILWRQQPTTTNTL